MQGCDGPDSIAVILGQVGLDEASELCVFLDALRNADESEEVALGRVLVILLPSEESDGALGVGLPLVLVEAFAGEF